MRISSISLSWFRGAAKEAVLVADGGSAVVFGPNGSGKSSFVDGLEICVRDGKVSHLAHEYSGKFQEKALINTHRPENTPTIVTVNLVGGKSAKGEWSASGRVQLSGLEHAPLNGWDYRRTALRQDEMAEFIKSTKAEKYSALLPLLGLEHLELAAENLRKLGKELAAASKLEDLKQKWGAAEQRRREVFGNATDTRISQRLDELAGVYCSDDAQDPATGARIVAAIEEKLNSLSDSTREAAALQEVDSTGVLDAVERAIRAVEAINETAEPFVEERLNVLLASDSFQQKVPAEVETLSCPACGTEQLAANFREHVALERKRLENTQQLFDSKRRSADSVCVHLTSYRNSLRRQALSAWNAKQDVEVASAIDFLDGIDTMNLRERPTASDLSSIKWAVGKTSAAVAASNSAVPPDVQVLLAQKEEASAIDEIASSVEFLHEIRRIETLATFLKKLESEVRDEIRVQAEQVFDAISDDIRRLWEILHPARRISEIRLHVPADAEKGIDIALTFHDVPQPSPRNTLSEGQRNGLGLCIFLALAKQDTHDRPIILDDVVVSLDRDHRSQIAHMLVSEFADRQVLLLTHDREWYFELSRILRQKGWRLHQLRSWVSPGVGIGFVEAATDFEKARESARVDPENALTIARRVMDVELSNIADKLAVPMPYLRGEANDHRTAGQFLPKISSAAKKAFRIRKSDGSYEKSLSLSSALDLVAPQLASWANRGTHTFSASESEALTLVDSCEAALECFVCDECRQPVWSQTDTAKGYLSCRCGKLQWKD